ncbi:MAG TPA: glycosyl hydrolase, partial [Flavisolibacter sp.]|nr:glycosyl hydrolase [Flavisolibacter sp.]
MKKLLPVICCFLFLHGIAQSSASPWFQSYEFKLAEFRKPSLRFGPMARWWWPGNLVTKEELKREVNVFADNGFAGVEVQPLNLAIPTANEEERKKVTGWDSPDYYDNLRAVMEEARRRGLIVDVTNGSGWPPSAPNLTPEDGFLSLEFSDTTVSGGQALSLTLPPLASSKNKTGIPPQLQAVVVAKVLNKATGNETSMLDATSSKVVNSLVKNGQLTYAFPEGTWQVIAFWSVPSGGVAMVAAYSKGMPVVNHFDSAKVLKLYNYLFGERTGLQPYFGNPMRAVFSDSYEFSVNRHYSPDFLS